MTRDYMGRAEWVDEARAALAEMDDEDRTPTPDGLDEAIWRKADEVFHATSLVADDTACVRTIYDALALVPHPQEGGKEAGEAVAYQHRVRTAMSLNWSEWREGKANFSEGFLLNAGLSYEERPLYASPIPARDVARAEGVIAKDAVKVVQPCKECGRENRFVSEATKGGWRMLCNCGFEVSASGENAADNVLLAWNGDRPSVKVEQPHADLIGQIEALLRLDASNALVPHGIGGHARELLTRAVAALTAPVRAAEVKGRTINVNDKFAVRLTHSGYHRLCDCLDIRASNGKIVQTGDHYVQTYHPEQPDGTRIFQLHELMHFFCPLLFNGNSKLPFDTTITAVDAAP
jgi:hypothetical protein